MAYKYQKISEDIKKKIQSGKYKPDDKLPVEDELCSIYSASRITVRQAMEQLVSEGFVSKKRGSGTYVKATSPENITADDNFADLQLFGGFTHDNPGKKVSSKVHLYALEPAEKKIAEKLQIKEGEFICHIIRTRLIDDEPCVVEYTYMPTEFIKGMTEEIVEGSIYKYLEEELGLNIKSAHRVVRAAMPSRDEKNWLDIKRQEIPVLEVEQVAYLDDGRIYEYSISHHRADRFILKGVSVSR